MLVCVVYIYIYIDICTYIHTYIYTARCTAAGVFDRGFLCISYMDSWGGHSPAPELRALCAALTVFGQIVGLKYPVFGTGTTK